MKLETKIENKNKSKDKIKDIGNNKSKDKSKAETQFNNEISDLRTRLTDLKKQMKGPDKANAESDLNIHAIESSINSIFMTNLNGKITYVNKSFLSVHGYNKKEDIIDKPFNKLFKDKNKAKEILKNICSNETWIGELLAKKADGSTFNTKFSAGIVKDFDNKPISIQGSFIDITNQKKIEEALIKSEEYFKSIIENSQDVITIFQKDGTVIYDSPSIERVLGYNQAEVVGKKIFELIHKDDLAKFTEMFNDMIEKPKNHNSFEYRIKHKDGSWCVLEGIGKVFQVKEDVEEIILNSRNITDRKFAEHSLEKSKAGFHNIVEMSTDAIIVVDSKGIICFINPTAQQIFNKNIGEFIGDIVSSSVMVDNKSEIEIIRQNGKPGTGEMTVSETEWEGGSAYLISIRDITTRKRIEKALRKSEEKFRDLANLLPQTVFEVDLAGNFIFVNQHALDSTGYTQDDIDEKRLNALNLFIPEDQERVMENMMKKFSGEDFENHEYTIMRKNGSTYPVLVYSSPIIQDDTPLGLRGIVLDISDRKRAEEALKDSEEKFRLLFENAHEGILTLDTKGDIKDVNPRLLEITGFSRKDLLGKNIIDLLPNFNLNPNEVLSSFKKMTSDKSSNMTEWVITDKNGKQITILVKLALIEKDGEVFVASLTVDNITKRKQAEHKLNRTLTDLERSNKELQQFAYVASHDLQEPLRMIASYLQLLERRYDDKLDSDAHVFINFAVDGAKRMQSLINDLLSYSRVGTRGKRFESTDTEAILNQALSNLRLMIEDAGAEVTHDKLPLLNCDDTQIGQLFQNLLSNALKFHDEGSPKVHISAKEMDNEWIFSVCDNGIGINPKYSEKAFMIFQRLHNKNDYPGTGIGLAICKRIVERHKGKIWFESEFGNGTTFYFTVPMEEGV